MQVLNLDKVKPPAKFIHIDDKKFKIPASLTLDMQLSIMALEQDIQNKENIAKGFELLSEKVHEIFAIENDITYKDFCKMVTIESLAKIVQFMAQPLEEAEKKTEQDQLKEEKQ